MRARATAIFLDVQNQIGKPADFLRYSKVQLGLHHWCIASAEPGSQLSQLGPSWVPVGSFLDLHGSEVTSSRGGKEQLFIVDQHASDEKFRFEAQLEMFFFLFFTWKRPGKNVEQPT